MLCYSIIVYYKVSHCSIIVYHIRLCYIILHHSSLVNYIFDYSILSLITWYLREPPERRGREGLDEPLDDAAAVLVPMLIVCLTINKECNCYV